MIFQFKSFKLLAVFIFLQYAFCSASSFAHNKPAEKVLQSLVNLDEFQTTEGNQIKLIRLNQGCRIEATFYGETGRNKENYLFSFIQNQPRLHYAARYEYHYSDGGLTNLSENHGKFSTTSKRVELDPLALTTKKALKVYLKLFPMTHLQRCV